MRVGEEEEEERAGRGGEEEQEEEEEEVSDAGHAAVLSAVECHQLQEEHRYYRNLCRYCKKVYRVLQESVHVLWESTGTMGKYRYCGKVLVLWESTGTVRKCTGTAVKCTGTARKCTGTAVKGLYYLF